MEDIINFLKDGKIKRDKISKIIKILIKNKINKLTIFLKIYDNQLKSIFTKDEIHNLSVIEKIMKINLKKKKMTKSIFSFDLK